MKNDTCFQEFDNFKVNFEGIQLPKNLTELNVTANGEYTPEQGSDGFSKVNVNVESAELILQDKVVEGYNLADEIIADDGYDGLKTVKVESLYEEPIEPIDYKTAGVGFFQQVSGVNAAIVITIPNDDVYLEYRTPVTNWKRLERGITQLCFLSKDFDGKIVFYLRGKGNTSLDGVNICGIDDVRFASNGYVESLLDYEHPDDVEPDEYAYQGLFANWEYLLLPLQFKTSKATIGMCEYMYSGCSCLQQLLFPAVEIIPDECFKHMYACDKSETTVDVKHFMPKQVGVMSYDGCFMGRLLYNSTVLLAMSKITVASVRSFYEMFKGCVIYSIELSPNYRMFESLSVIPDECCRSMFESSQIYGDLQMFFPACELGIASCLSMFENAYLALLSKEQYIQPITCGRRCCTNMCKSATLGDNRLYDLVLNINQDDTILAESAYAECFADSVCPSNTTVNILSSTVNGESCYSGMFSGNKGVKKFVMTANNTSRFSFASMFYDCLTLSDISECKFNWSSANRYCCQSMFKGCKALISFNVNIGTSDTSLYDSCYKSMFYESSLIISKTKLLTTDSFKILGDIMDGETNSLQDMFSYVHYNNGIDTPSLNTTYYTF